jgi:hypothetical protein
VRRSLGSIAAIAVMTVASCATLEQTRWEFRAPTARGVPPHGWTTEEASNTSYFRVENGALVFHHVPSDTPDRTKIRTRRTDYRSGTYEFRFFLPVPREEGTNLSIGAFLFSPQSSGDHHSREIDFEIGYGLPEARRAAGLDPHDRAWALAYMTVQEDATSGQERRSRVHPLRTGRWYTARLILDSRNGRYHVRWQIDDEELFETDTAYGPSDTAFTIVLSLETLDFIGGRRPGSAAEVRFDSVVYRP